MGGVWLPGSALTINLFLLIIFFNKKNINNVEVKVYSSLLIYGFFFSLNAFLVYIYSKIMGDEIIVGLMQKIHLSLLVVVASYFVSYMISIVNCRVERKKILHLLNKICAIILVILIFLLKVEVINYDDILDVGGMSYNVAISGVLIYFGCLIILNIKYFLENKNTIKKSIPFILLLIMFGIGLILRVHYPEIITETYCVAFALLVMYFTIENPDVKLIEQISLAKEHAEKANAAKTDFLSNMSHEIRTPLNAIVGFSEAIQDANSLEEAKVDAKDIIVASQNLLELVNGILDISKIEANKMEMTNTEYNLKEECELLYKLIKPRIGEKPIEFNMSIAPDLPDNLYGDKAKIREIISNLLTNAVKYTEAGEINFVVSCINTNNESSLVISIEDTGRGIKPEKIEKLFQKFERLEEDRNTTIEGAGLGLAITKSLVDMMNGKIIVQSVFGSGSKFTVYLKQKIVHRRNQEKNKRTSNEKLNLIGKRVLVVDDNELNLKVAEKLLQKYNLTVVSCDSGASCIDKIHNGEEYDLILMDDMMPKMSGTETLHVLKDISTFNTKVIALTANAIEGMKEKYIEAGFDDYISKPIDSKELERILRAYLNKEFETNHFEPIPDDFYEISDTAILNINK